LGDTRNFTPWCVSYRHRE